MTSRRILPVLCLLSSAFGLFSSLPDADAAGPALAKETRAITPFKRLDWDAAGELTVVQGDKESLELEAEPDVLKRIVAQVSDNSLSIKFAPGRLQTQAPIRFKLTVRSLEDIKLGGSGQAVLRDLNARQMSLRTSGSLAVLIDRLSTDKLTVRCEGSSSFGVEKSKARDQRVDLAGACDYSAADLSSADASVDISGSGSALMSVSNHLIAKISGSGSIEFIGNPKVDQQITGAGTIERRP